MNRTITTVALQSVIAAAIIVAAPLASAGSAAHTAYADPGADHVFVTVPFVSSVSREQVRAEAVAAARQPLLFTDSHNQPLRSAFVSTASRDQVRAEAVEANRIRLAGLFTDSQHQPLTPLQLEQIRTAGVRAANGDTVAAAAKR
jgi:hypothetical protein